MRSRVIRCTGTFSPRIVQRRDTASSSDLEKAYAKFKALSVFSWRKRSESLMKDSTASTNACWSKRMLVDIHTNLLWYPDHYSEEFLEFSWAAKKAKMRLTPDVYCAVDD